MSLIKKKIIDEIKEKSDIVSIASDYFQVKKSGKYYVANCPFHGEKTPSFFIYPETNSFHCFGCGKHGDNISLVMDMESLDYIEAIKKLANKFNINLEYEDGFVENNKNFNIYYEMNNFAAKYYYKNMMINTIPKQYLNSRKITQKSINNFLIGYADSNWKSLYNELLKNNKNLRIAEELGLIIKTKNGDYIDRFRNRIIFPIQNKNKDIIGFGGRTIVDDKAKYLNSPESVIFKKGDNLYAIDKLLNNNIRKKVLIVEGYMDVISLYQNGINYAVAGLGTAFTENQARLAKKYSRGNVFLCYDNDNAGRTATNKTADIFSKIDVNVNVVKLNDKKDPDEFIKSYGVEKFNLLIDNAIDIYEYNYFNLKEIKKDLISITDNGIFYESVLEFLSNINGNVLRDMYIDKVSKDFGLKKDSIIKDFSKYKEHNENTNDYNNINDNINNREINNILLNYDKKVLIMGIILLMKCDEKIINITDKILQISLYSNLKNIVEYLYENYNRNIVTLPNMLIDKFKNSNSDLKKIDYILKYYKNKNSISSQELEKIISNSLLNIKIRILTENIEKLQNMDKSNQEINSILNSNINELMELNNSLRNHIERS